MTGSGIHIIINPSSRTGRTMEIWEDIEEELKRRSISYTPHFTKGSGHATELAKEISLEAKNENKEKTIFLIGGDGTANEVINGISDFQKIRFGYVPTGSGNDLGRGLKIEREPKEQMLHVISSKDEILMDLGEVCLKNGVRRKFSISAGIGLDAVVCKKALSSKLKVFLNKLGLGSLTYGILTVISLFSMDVSDAELKIKGEGKENNQADLINEKNMIFTAAMNHPFEGGGVPMCPGADATDGLLSMISVSDVKRIKCLFSFPKLLMAKHENVSGFKLFKCEEINIKLLKKMVIHADGEYLGTEDEVTFRCLRGMLRVII